MSIEDSAAQKLQRSAEKKPVTGQSYDLRVLDARGGRFTERDVESALSGINEASSKMTAREAQLAANKIREYISSRGSVPEALRRKLDVSLSYLKERMTAAAASKEASVVSLDKKKEERQKITDSRLREVRQRLDFEENRPMADNGAFNWVEDEKMKKARDIEKIRASAKKEKPRGAMGFIKGLFGG